VLASLLTVARGIGGHVTNLDGDRSRPLAEPLAESDRWFSA
jgi:hypothetical protein